MAPIRFAGTRRAIANALADKPSGSRNSSARISPGWVVMRCGVMARAFLVVVNDLDVLRALGSPVETEAPLIVDPNRILALAIASEDLQPVARDRSKIGQAYGCMQGIQ